MSEEREYGRSQVETAKTVNKERTATTRAREEEEWVGEEREES
jgi:hypothetical protein